MYGLDSMACASKLDCKRELEQSVDTHMDHGTRIPR